MPRYYFVWDDDQVTTDDEGVLLDGIETVIALADIARDVIPGTTRRVLTIEVRDEAKRPLLEARLVFEIAPVLADA
jgi:hypothetical protein